MVKAIIIDDENKAVSFIQSVIVEYCEEIEVVKTANSARAGKLAIETFEPDLVFLDVEMPNGNGFDLLESLDQINFDVVFITAYDHYAIKAIKYSAADYILKPIDVEELVSSVKAILKQKEERNELPDYNILFENLKTTAPIKLAIPTGKGMEYVNTTDIIRIEADRSYSNVFLTDKTKILVSRSLVEFHELLLDRNFFRSHNSHLINLEHVKAYARQDGGYIEMIDGSNVSLARSKREMFMERMKHMSLNLKR